MRKPLALAWLPRVAVREMWHEAGRTFPLETGGILMGYWTRPLREVVVTVAIGPGPNAVHERLSFAPDHEFQCAQIADTYRSTNRTETYLGDWHAHPFGSGSLSRSDQNTLGRIARTRTARLKHPLMLVLAGEPAGWEIAIWCYHSMAGLWGRAAKMDIKLYGYRLPHPGSG